MIVAALLTFFSGRDIVKILKSNSGGRELVSWDPISRHEVHAQGVTPGCYEEAHGYHHGQSSTMSVSCSAENRRNDRPSADTADNESRPAFAVLPETSHAQCNDGREADRFEEQRYVEHGHTSVVSLRYSWSDEDDTHRYVEQEHFARSYVLHE